MHIAQEDFRKLVQRWPTVELEDLGDREAQTVDVDVAKHIKYFTDEDLSMDRQTFEATQEISLHLSSIAQSSLVIKKTLDSKVHLDIPVTSAFDASYRALGDKERSAIQYVAQFAASKVTDHVEHFKKVNDRLGVVPDDAVPSSHGLIHKSAVDIYAPSEIVS